MNNAILDKALAFIDNGKVRLLEPDDDWPIRASVDSTATYIVKINANSWSCTCPAGQHGRICSHVEAVAIYQGQAI